MSKSPKQKAIEKVCQVLYANMPSSLLFSNLGASEFCLDSAKAIINALNVEFVDGESEPQLDDLVRQRWCDDSISHIIWSEEDANPTAFAMANKHFERPKIIQRNDRSVINVDNIGEAKYGKD